MCAMGQTVNTRSTAYTPVECDRDSVFLHLLGE
jgi:hypothetical protein